MQFAIQFHAVAGRDVIQKFRPHLSVTTEQVSAPVLAMQAERRIGKRPTSSSAASARWYTFAYGEREKTR